MAFIAMWPVISFIVAILLIRPSEDMSEDELRLENPWPRVLVSIGIGLFVSVTIVVLNPGPKDGKHGQRGSFENTLVPHCIVNVPETQGHR